MRGGLWDATFTQIPTGDSLLDVTVAAQVPPSQGVATELVFPASLSAGLAWTGTSGWTYEADFIWTQWSAFEKLPLMFDQSPALNTAIIENYDDQFAIRVGAEHRLATWTYRLGYYFDSAAAPSESVTPLLPDANRHGVTLGLGTTRGRWTADLYNLFVFVEKRSTEGVERDGCEARTSPMSVAGCEPGVPLVRGGTNMKVSLRFRLGIVLALAAALAGCEGPCTSIERINGPTLSSNGVDLTTYVAVGTSLSSGYMSGGLVDRHQVHSFPALFATQIGKSVQIDGQGTFTFPAINGDGIPPLLEIRSYNPPALSNSGRVLGSPTNFTQPSAYHNLGIPGAVLLDLVDSTHYHATVPPVNRTNFAYWDIIQRRRGVLLQQALSLQPTIMSVEYGANELLGPTVNAGTSPNPATNLGHAALMTAAMNAIHTVLPGTRVAVVNVPDVTSIPFFTTIPPFAEVPGVGVFYFVGADSQLTANDLVLLSAAPLLAQGFGVPGNPLPESVILRAPEVRRPRSR